jgi:hypothetical protein
LAAPIAFGAGFVASGQAAGEHLQPGRLSLRGGAGGAGNSRARQAVWRAAQGGGSRERGAAI